MIDEASSIYAYQALKLDASFKPIGIIPSIDALVSSLVGKTRILETYDRNISSATRSFALPSVVVIDRVARSRKFFPCNRKFVFIRDDSTCQYCQKKLVKADATLDHVIPRSRGGKLNWTNVVLACKNCNQRKGSRTPEEAGMKLTSKPKPLDYHQYLLATSIDFEAWKDYL